MALPSGSSRGEVALVGRAWFGVGPNPAWWRWSRAVVYHGGARLAAVWPLLAGRAVAAAPMASMPVAPAGLCLGGRPDLLHRGATRCLAGEAMRAAFDLPAFSGRLAGCVEARPA
jgi:hypothetical protein